MSFSMTEEQRAIVSASKSFDDITINACAGSGKSTSLKQVTQARPEANALLFCFNKSIQQQAQVTMPSWCKSSTFHGIAYGQIGKYFAPKLKVPLSPYSICRALRLKPHEENVHLATVAKYTLRRFCQSDDSAILGHHVPHKSVMAKDEKDRNSFRDGVVTASRKLWLLAMNVKEKEVGIEHDFYQKYFDLEGAKIPGQYDVILVDEAQDMSPVNLSILRKQYGQKILVGDSAQSLYAWKGSIDSLEVWAAQHRMNLTKSFRFGQVIADCANRTLGLLDTPYPKITGAEWKDSRIEYSKPEGKHVVLCRSNSGLLGEALTAIRQGKTIHVINGIMDSINLIESAWYLSIGEVAKVKHPTMKSMGSWENVVEMAKEDADMSTAVKRVEEYGSAIPRICTDLRNAGEASEEHADVVLSTVHRFKGKQASVVKLSEDFPDLVRWNKKERRYKANKAEVFVFYVAVTRAEDVLIANSTVANLNTLKELL